MERAALGALQAAGRVHTAGKRCREAGRGRLVKQAVPDTVSSGFPEAALMLEGSQDPGAPSSCCYRGARPASGFSSDLEGLFPALSAQY